MKALMTFAWAALLALPLFAEDAKPPDAPPPDAPPEEPKPPSEEELRLRMVEEKAKEKADTLKKRMDAAKTDGERTTAISDCVGGSNNVQHPIIVEAVLPYLNPRQIKAGLIYGNSVNTAALDVLKKEPFDETYYGVMKFINNNRTNLNYVKQMITVFGEIKCVKAVDELTDMLRDKRDGKIELCKEAATQLGKIGHRDAISDLIAELEEQDKAGPNDTKMKDRRAALNVPVVNALKQITGQDFKLGSQYRSWWIKNAETFQKEPKKAPEGEPK